jgi:hypothetical protein
MDKEFVYELMIDSLCGELSPEGEERLRLALQEDPELEEMAKEIEKTWQELDEAYPEQGQGNRKVLDRIFERIVSSRPDELLEDDDLDKAAGGVTNLSNRQPGSDNTNKGKQ